MLVWLIRLALVPWIHAEVPYALVFLGIAVAAILGGWRSGLVALVAGDLLVWWSVVEPRWSFTARSGDDTNGLVVAIASQAILLGAVALYQREVRSAWAARDEMDRRRDVLAEELNHRVKNTLAIVQSVAKQTFSAGGGPDALKSFESRLQNLAASHDLLTEQDWRPAPIREVVQRALRPFHTADAFTIQGPEFAVPPKTAVMLSLGLHELATNAVKYGALSVPGGQIVLEWRLDDGPLKLKWSEHGGPPVTAPARRGFGTRMIERGLATELGGTVEMAFEERGLVCEITASKAALSNQA